MYDTKRSKSKMFMKVKSSTYVNTLTQDNELFVKMPYVYQLALTTGGDMA